MTLHDCEVVYACDHEKHTQCKKSGCKFNPEAVENECESTPQREFAKLDKDGNPIINWINYQGKLFIRWGYESEANEIIIKALAGAVNTGKKQEAEIVELKTRTAALEAALAELKACSTCKFRGFPEESNECDKCLNGLENYYEFDVERYVKNGETE